MKTQMSPKQIDIFFRRSLQFYSFCLNIESSKVMLHTYYCEQGMTPEQASERMVVLGKSVKINLLIISIGLLLFGYFIRKLFSNEITDAIGAIMTYSGILVMIMCTGIIRTTFERGAWHSILGKFKK